MFKLGAWFLKIVGVIAGFVALMYVPNSFFEGYVQIARVLSVLFILFETVIFIDLFYLWGEIWAENYNNGNNHMQYVMVGTAIGLYAGYIAFMVQNFVYFTGSLNVGLSVINIILTIIMTILTISGFHPRGSLITSGAVSLFFAYFNFLGLASNPEFLDNQLYFNENS
jgi:hypothetical protein